MITKSIKTILFALLIAVMILPVSGMNFNDMPEAFAMQHTVINNKYFQNMGLAEITANEATQKIRDNKATSFNPIYFEHSYTDKIPDRSNRGHK